MSRWRLPLLAAGVVGATVAQAVVHSADFPSLDRHILLGLLALPPYGMAAWLVLRRRQPRGSLAVVLVAAALLRIVPLAWTPFLSTDLYRYIWDGRVQLAGVNPYRYIPADPALAALRDPDVYARINRADYAPTIYPPAAQGLFAAIAAIWPTPMGVRLVMLGLETLAVLVMLRLLRLAELPRERVLLYAWQPAWGWEYAGNGHIDAAAILCVGLALLATARRREGWAGVALAAAFMVKFLPAVIAPALWRWRGWRMPAAAVATVAAGYGAYASAGWNIFGFLGGYASEEGISGGGGLLAVQLASLLFRLPPWAGTAWLGLVGVAVAGLALRMTRPVPDAIAPRLRGHAHDAMLLAIVTSVAFTPHYAWYFGWLAYLACLVPWWSVLWLTAACILLYVHPFQTDLERSLLLYVPFALLAWLDARRAVPA